MVTRQLSRLRINALDLEGYVTQVSEQPLRYSLVWMVYRVHERFAHREGQG
jgi:hypothetical protein